MRIIVPERSIRQLSILSARLPVDAVEQAFFFDTNDSESFLRVRVHDWLKNCCQPECLHIPIFRVPTPCHNREY